MTVLGGKGGVDVTFLFCDPQKYIIAQNCVCWYVQA